MITGWTGSRRWCPPLDKINLIDLYLPDISWSWWGVFPSPITGPSGQPWYPVPVIHRKPGKAHRIEGYRSILLLTDWYYNPTGIFSVSDRAWYSAVIIVVRLLRSWWQHGKNYGNHSSPCRTISPIFIFSETNTFLVRDRSSRRFNRL